MQFGGSRLHLMIKSDLYYMGFWANDCASQRGNKVGQQEKVAFVYDSAARTQTIYANGAKVMECANRGAFNHAQNMVKLGAMELGAMEPVEIPCAPHSGHHIAVSLISPLPV